MWNTFAARSLKQQKERVSPALPFKSSSTGLNTIQLSRMTTGYSRPSKWYVNMSNVGFQKHIQQKKPNVQAWERKPKAWIRFPAVSVISNRHRGTVKCSGSAPLSTSQQVKRLDLKGIVMNITIRMPILILFNDSGSVNNYCRLLPSAVCCQMILQIFKFNAILSKCVFKGAA